MSNYHKESPGICKDRSKRVLAGGSRNFWLFTELLRSVDFARRALELSPGRESWESRCQISSSPEGDRSFCRPPG